MTGPSPLTAISTYLSLGGCPNLTDHMVSSLLDQQEPALAAVHLSLCRDVTDRSLGRLTTNYLALATLGLGGCTGVTNSNLLPLARGLPRLTTLSLRTCWQRSDTGPDPPARQGRGRGVGAGVPVLADLNLQNCQKLTNISLHYTSQGLRITAINLSFCANISDSSLKSAARMATLASLNLRSCDNIGDIGLQWSCTPPWLPSSWKAAPRGSATAWRRRKGFINNLIY